MAEITEVKVKDIASGKITVIDCSDKPIKVEFEGTSEIRELKPEKKEGWWDELD